MNRRNRRILGVLAGLIGGPALLCGMGGCLTYSNYPPEPGVTWVNATDTASIREPMAKALKHVIEKDLATQKNLNLPASGSIVAINLPGGIAPESYRWVAANAHPRAEVLSETTDPNLPVYHIGEVAIRHSRVRVDVIRPITGLEQGVAEPVYVGVEVHMRGATGTRQIERDRPREVGTLTPPELFTIEDVQRAYDARRHPVGQDDGAVEEAPAEESQPETSGEG
ncbi:MAG: hypothetical protein KDA31_08270 [Phycisphaerales bacterium]|nr:hypothetical protein [Phycisphaerales bacterium]MCB9835905.1 hypothetical protein [Phycisphaera sp.]